MKFSEIVKVILEDQQQDSILLTTLNYLYKKSKKENATRDSGEDSKFDMDSLINYVQNGGYPNFEYENFVAAYERNPAIKNLVSDYNEEFVTWNLSQSPGKVTDQEQQTADISQMAQQAVSL
jgi:hypothetical protein